MEISFLMTPIRINRVVSAHRSHSVEAFGDRAVMGWRHACNILLQGRIYTYMKVFQKGSIIVSVKHKLNWRETYGYFFN